jgi:hypothetical protein
MANHVHPDGWMWGEGIAVNNESFTSDAQQCHHYDAYSHAI